MAKPTDEETRRFVEGAKQRHKERFERLMRDPKIRAAIERDQRPKPAPEPPGGE